MGADTANVATGGILALCLVASGGCSFLYGQVDLELASSPVAQSFAAEIDDPEAGVRRVAEAPPEAPVLGLPFPELPYADGSKVCRVVAHWSDTAGSAEVAIHGGSYSFPKGMPPVLRDLRSTDGSGWWATHRHATIGLAVRAARSGHWLCVGEEDQHWDDAAWDGEVFSGRGALEFRAYRPVRIRRYGCSFLATVPSRVCVDVDERRVGEDYDPQRSGHGIAVELGDMPVQLATVSIDGAAPIPLTAFGPRTTFRAETLAVQIDRLGADPIRIDELHFQPGWHVRIRISAD